MNKIAQGTFLGLFILMIFALIIVVTSGIFVYVGVTTSQALHTQLDNQSTANVNYTQILQTTIDKVPAAYQVLKWGSVVLIFAMILSIFISSYLVTTKPIFFLAETIFVLMAVMLAVVIANVYDDILNTSSDLATVLQSFTASNFMLLNLPVIIGVVGMIGGIIMFASYKLGAEQYA